MQIVIESLALAAFGTMLRNTEEPLLKKLLRYVMSDEARHVAFGVLSLAEYYQGLTEAELKDRQEFLIENTLRNRARSTTPEIWERMGVNGRGRLPGDPRGRGQAQGQPLRRVPAGLLRQAGAERPQARAARRQRRLPAQGVGRGRPARVRVRRRHRLRLRDLRRGRAGPRRAAAGAAARERPHPARCRRPGRAWPTPPRRPASSTATAGPSRWRWCTRPSRTPA